MTTADLPRRGRVLATLIALGVASYAAAGSALFSLWVDADGAGAALLSIATLFVLVCWTAGVARLYTRLRNSTKTVPERATVQPLASAADVHGPAVRRR